MLVIPAASPGDYTLQQYFPHMLRGKHNIPIGNIVWWIDIIASFAEHRKGILIRSCPRMVFFIRALIWSWKKWLCYSINIYWKYDFWLNYIKIRLVSIHCLSVVPWIKFFFYCALVILAWRSEISSISYCIFFLRSSR